MQSVFSSRMEKKIVFWILILSGSLLQAFASLSEKDSNTSSDLHVRKKRVIDNTDIGANSILYQEVRYVVALVNHDQFIQCTGIILSSRIILTAAHCIYNVRFVVLSGKLGTPTQRQHTVAFTTIHENYDPNGLISNDIGLVLIHEPIDMYRAGSYNKPISIYSGTLPPNIEAVASGFGDCSRNSTSQATRVRSISVPVLSPSMCYRMMHKHVPVTTKHICTYYTNRRKCCWYGDSGGPLVYAGHLIGLFSTFNKSNDPVVADIFMNLLDPEYKSWIETWRKNILNTIDQHHH